MRDAADPLLEAAAWLGELTPQALLCFAPDGRVVAANAAFEALGGAQHLDELAPAFQRLLGWRAEGPVPELLEPDGQWRAEGLVADAHGRAHHLFVRVRCSPDGAHLAALLEDQGGHHERDLARQAELDSVLVGIVTVGALGIEWMNRPARRMFGAHLAHCVGRSLEIVAGPEPGHPLRHPQRFASLAEGEAASFECLIHALDGRNFWVAGNAVATGQGEARRLTFALLDIDRRREAEARLEAAHASLARIIDAAPLAITLHDARTHGVERANQAAADIAGRQPEDLVGAPPEAIFGPASARGLAADIERALRADIGAVIERELRAGAGAAERVWDLRLLHLGGNSQDVAAGDAGQVLIVASDVTAQRAAEAERLRDAIAQRELLVREVHHRIKNNLQGVAGLLQGAAARRPELAEPIREAVGQVNAIAQVYGLRVGAAGALPLLGVLQAVVGSLGRVHGRVLQCEAAPGVERWLLPEAEAIPIALTLNELVTNAIKHGAPNAVHCRVDAARDGASVSIVNAGRLPAGFESDGGADASGSGLGLVRALLPRRGTKLTIEQRDTKVLARVELRAPAVTEAA